jgi:ATP-dependent DNA helicase PIF1
MTSEHPPINRRRRTVLGDVSVNITRDRGSIRTYNRLDTETADAATLRREKEATAKNLRRRSRALLRGDILSSPLPLVPSRHAPAVMTRIPASSPPMTQAPTPSQINRLFFRCSCCQTNRCGTRLVNGNLNIPDCPVCEYCLFSLAEDDNEFKFCADCRREKSRDMFFTSAPVALERDTCMDCRNSSQPPPRQPIPTPPEPIGAVPDSEWRYIQTFHKELDKLALTECVVCDERWFDMKLDNTGICSRCRGQQSNPWTALNNGDVGSVPDYLPALTEIEEMLIARAHVHVQVRQVKGQQFKYTGHTVIFMQNTSKIYDKLPLLASELDIILLKPASNMVGDTRAINEQFQRAFRVRRRCVQTWLDFLKENHPDYRYITIDREQLALLPEDDSIHESLPVNLTLPEDPATTPGPTHVREDTLGLESAENNDTTSMIPDLRPEITEFERLRRDLLGIPLPHPLLPTPPPAPSPTLLPSTPHQLSVATFRQTPISEFDKKCLLRMIFPTLFPFGQGDINLPRRDPIAFSAWIRHVLRYKDGRFARHSRFSYVVFNMSMRQQARARATYICSKIDDADMSFEDLQERVRHGESDSLIGHITRSAHHLRGTRPYWNLERHKLETIVHNIQCPSIFVTFSAADIQWNDLHYHMPNYPGDGFLTDPTRHTIASKNVTQNPHIVAQYLYRRFLLFFKTTIKKVLPVADYWFRYEWQQRGSGHIHGFLWLRDHDPPSTVSEATRAKIVEYWFRHITAINPDSTLPLQGVNPASLPFSLQENTESHLTHSLNRFQRHKICTPSYCLRQPKGQPDTQPRCRFHFPQAHRETAGVTRDHNPLHWKYMPQRIDTLINAYIPAFTLRWMANTDMAPCTNVSAVLNYIAKYASKGEVKSNSYKQIFADVSRYSSTNHPVLTAAIKMMNTLLIERDWSAQEVMHHLLGLSLVVSSRQVVSVDLRQDQVALVEATEEGFQKKGLSILAKYTNRLSYTCPDDVDSQNITLFDFARHWNVQKDALLRRPRAKARCLNIFPRFSSDAEGEDYEQFCRLKMMLHHPFVEPESLKRVQMVDNLPTFRCAYELCLATGCFHEHDPLDPILDEEDETFSDYEDYGGSGSEREQPAFIELAGRAGRHDAAYAEPGTGLGMRPLDTSYDWHSNDGIYGEFGDQSDFYQQAKLLEVSIPRVYNNPNTLTGPQRTCFDRLMAQYTMEIDDGQVEQLFLHVDGSAGTGKSYLIDMISSHLFLQSQAVSRRDPVIRGAPTGVAAYNIHGRTLHSLLCLPIKGHLNPLSNSVLIRLQQVWQNCRFLIIDEKSMLGLKQLYWIDCRLRQLIPFRSDIPFGGINIVLFGDFYQLPPVCEQALYDTRPTNSPEGLAAQALYRLFDKTIVLKKIMRQQGEDETSIAFRETLEGLRYGEITRTGFDLLSSRVQDMLPSAERVLFDKALRLYPTRRQVRAYNLTALENLRHPVIRIKSKHNCSAAAKASEEDADGLYSELLLSRCCRIMITSNLLTSFGLVNGTLGVLHDLVWRPEDDPFVALPSMILIKPDAYPEGGPSLFMHNNSPVIPILPMTREWDNGPRKLSRTSFPIVLAYAITIHKSQGLSLDRIVMDISERDRATGSSYVGISRSRTLEGIMFDTAFDISRFTDRDISPVKRLREEDKRRRSSQIVEDL